MEKQENLIKSNIIKYFIIWIAFLIELAILFAVFYIILAPDQPVQSTNTSDISILYLSYLLTIIAVPACFKIYDYFKRKCSKDQSTKTKLDKYMFALISKYALLETAAVLSLIAFYFNQIYAPLYMFGVVFVTFLINKPSISQFKKDFLKEEDKKDRNVILETQPKSENITENIDNSK